MFPKNIRVAALNIPNVFQLNTIGDKIFADGSEGKLLQCLAEKLNFEYEVILSPDNQWGSRNENGTWNGIVGLVQNVKAGFAMPVLGITEERMKDLDFTPSYDLLEKIFATKEPGEMSKITSLHLSIYPKCLDLVHSDDPCSSSSVPKNDIQERHSLGWFLFGVGKHRFTSHGKCQRDPLEEGAAWFVAVDSYCPAFLVQHQFSVLPDLARENSLQENIRGVVEGGFEWKIQMSDTHRDRRSRIVTQK
ncbi:uncharacterized protein TNCT_499721 [Trichonephila clavata]|uniref:Ionotropic glutamate receptor L-glutamate and glycine-binding domain-containing protein n=1 Tax=Trichonephila clavata TaxID=2740835 RepID=A0A8X6KTR5_TRICU|nr:uncharacterized protein TNCT_499721 [Trichonephila clavata]